ncbi:MAG: hypothetical protein IJK64_03665 [Clostridia bacterium]|nr:hypothetical protein [Clostridia bacterium]
MKRFANPFSECNQESPIKTPRSTLLFRQRASLFMVLLQTVCDGLFRGADPAIPPADERIDPQLLLRDALARYGLLWYNYEKAVLSIRGTFLD